MEHGPPQVGEHRGPSQSRAHDQFGCRRHPGGSAFELRRRNEGSFWIEITGEITAQEPAFLKKLYSRLGEGEADRLVRALTRIRAGEIQPHCIPWRGFYEGKTPWRTDPITIAFVFGLRTLEEIDNAFRGRLHEVMTTRFAEGRWESGR